MGFWKIWKVPYTFYIVDDDAKEILENREQIC